MNKARPCVREEPMRHVFAALVAACIAAPSAVAADTLELTDGRVLQGSFRGGTPELLHFEIDGVLRAVPVTDVVSVRFPGAQSPQAAGPAAQVAPPAPPQPVVARVPAGTRLRIRLVDTLDPRLQTTGDRFSGLLEMELQHDGTTVVAPQSRVYGRISEIRGGPAGGLSLELTELQVAGVLQPIVTGTQQLATTGSDSPAAPAAATERIPAGTLLEFRLLQPFEVALP
jgi:hypothetical protein